MMGWGHWMHAGPWNLPRVKTERMAQPKNQLPLGSTTLVVCGSPTLLQLHVRPGG